MPEYSSGSEDDFGNKSPHTDTAKAKKNQLKKMLLAQNLRQIEDGVDLEAVESNI